MQTQLLNKVVAYLRSQGIDLQPTEQTANAVISLCILTLKENGMTIEEAADFILGEGTVKRISDAVWEHCNQSAQSL